MLVEEFQNNIPEEIRIYLSERKRGRVHKLGVMTDEYAITHKNRKQKHPPPLTPIKTNIRKFENRSNSGKFIGSNPETRIAQSAVIVEYTDWTSERW